MSTVNVGYIKRLVLSIRKYKKEAVCMPASFTIFILLLLATFMITPPFLPSLLALIQGLV